MKKEIKAFNKKWLTFIIAVIVWSLIFEAIFNGATVQFYAYVFFVWFAMGTGLAIGKNQIVNELESDDKK